MRKKIMGLILGLMLLWGCCISTPGGGKICVTPGTPTARPTALPTTEPSSSPTIAPTAEPTPSPTPSPSPEPTAIPTVAPTPTPGHAVSPPTLVRQKVQNIDRTSSREPGKFGCHNPMDGPKFQNGWCEVGSTPLYGPNELTGFQNVGSGPCDPDHPAQFNTFCGKREW